MSLATTAAPWTNDNQNNTTRRRIPYARRTTIKQNRAYPQQQNDYIAPANDDADSGLYVSVDDDYTNPATEEALARGTGKKPEKSAINNAAAPNIQEILNKIQKFDSMDGGGGALADFRPPPPPEIHGRLRTQQPIGSQYVESMVSGSGNGGSGNGGGGSGGSSEDNIPIYTPAPPISKIAAANDLGLYTNYHTGYEPPKNLMSIGLGTRSGGGGGGTHGSGLDTISSTLMEKLNHIIHMLEEQQHERTSNVTEELILYTFLGVFIIFMCDTFARAGKYYR